MDSSALGWSPRRPARSQTASSTPGFVLDLDDQPWMDDGLCAQTDPEIFFPEKGGSTQQAKRTCLSCPVRSDCLEYALEHHERYGIWGGLSERERRKLVKPRCAA